MGTIIEFVSFACFASTSHAPQAFHATPNWAVRIIIVPIRCNGMPRKLPKMIATKRQRQRNRHVGENIFVNASVFHWPSWAEGWRLRRVVVGIRNLLKNRHLDTWRQHHHRHKGDCTTTPNAQWPSPHLSTLALIITAFTWQAHECNEWGGGWGAGRLVLCRVARNCSMQLHAAYAQYLLI